MTTLSETGGIETNLCVHFASAAIQHTSQQHYTGANDLGYLSRSRTGDPFPVIDHRMMLDVEIVVGPTLLS